MKSIDITGQRFQQLTAVRLVPDRPRTTWLCRCDCGNEVEVRKTNLASGNSKSCGCRVPDVAAGWAGTPEYTAFRNAKNRCERKADPRYSNYGGRGIAFRFCTMTDFIAAIGPRPSPDHSLDRIDTDGHYEPGNVRWATKQEQARNKTTSIIVTAFGRTAPLIEFCQEYGQPYKRAWERIRAFGWEPERAIAEGAEITARKQWGTDDGTLVIVEVIG